MWYCKFRLDVNWTLQSVWDLIRASKQDQRKNFPLSGNHIGFGLRLWAGSAKFATRYASLGSSTDRRKWPEKEIFETRHVIKFSIRYIAMWNACQWNNTKSMSNKTIMKESISFNSKLLIFFSIYILISNIKRKNLRI